MSKPKDGPAVHFEVEDAEAAFRKMEDAARRLLGVSKKPDAVKKEKRSNKTRMK